MKLITQRGEQQEYRDEETGRLFYSVTQVRKVAFDSYAGVSESVLEPARVRGTILHRRFFFAMASLEGLCPYPAVIPQYEGYCRSMDQWIEKRKPTRLKLETTSCNLLYGYAGTPDALLEMLLPINRRVSRIRRVLFDLKTGAPTRTDPMQLCAYEHMEGYKADELLDVYLDADGGEAKEQFVTKGSRATEWACFLNALALLKWRNGK
jgi:hypothetical protein